MSEEIIALNCKSCGVRFGILKMLYDSFQENGGYYTCTNGHRWGWDDSNSKRATDQREQQRIKQRCAQLEDEIKSKDQQIAAANAEAARAKRRTANGVCPCCTRSFGNVERHIRNKHPDFQKGTKLVCVASAKATAKQ